MTIARTIRVYTHSGCPGGDRAVRFFQSQGIPISIRDIAQNPDAWAEFQALGCIGTPVILIDDKRFVGFEEEVIRTHLGLETGRSPGRWSYES